MRQHGVPYQPPANQIEYQPKGWYQEPQYAPSVAKPFYGHIPAQPQMVVNSYQPQTIPYPNYQTYRGGVPANNYSYPVYRQEAYYPEAEPQMLIYPQQSPQIPVQMHSHRPYAPSPAARPQIAPNVVNPPPVQTERVEAKQNTIDPNFVQAFDQNKFPTPGCFGLVRRGNLPSFQFSMK